VGGFVPVLALLGLVLAAVAATYAMGLLLAVTRAPLAAGPFLSGSGGQGSTVSLRPAAVGLPVVHQQVGIDQVAGVPKV
jgi:hypothetical protein